MSDEQVAVVGAGAVGVMYAAALEASRPGNVTLVTRRPEAWATLSQGLTVTRPDRPALTSTPAIAQLDHLSSRDISFDAVIFAVPAYDTVKVAVRIAPVLRSPGICVSVQNGLDNAAVLSDALGAERVVQGATSFAVSLVEPTHSSVDGIGATWLPELATEFAWLTGWLAEAGLNPKPIADPERLAWTKAAIGINGFICLVLNAPLGKTLGSEYARTVALRAAMEVADVAEKCGQPLDRDEISGRLHDAWATMGTGARSSLFSSLAAGRRPEIEERLGTVIRRAEKLAVQVPTLLTLYELANIRLAIGQT